MGRPVTIDDAKLLDAARDVFLEKGAAATTDEALARIEAHRPDLLMLGLDKPGRSGLQMLADVRQRFAASDLPVILMTYGDSTLDVVKALHLGANDFLAKPLNGAIMLARVRMQLQLREAMAALEQANRAWKRWCWWIA